MALCLANALRASSSHHSSPSRGKLSVSGVQIRQYRLGISFGPSAPRARPAGRLVGRSVGESGGGRQKSYQRGLHMSCKARAIWRNCPAVRRMEERSARRREKWSPMLFAGRLLILAPLCSVLLCACGSKVNPLGNYPSVLPASDVDRGATEAAEPPASPTTSCPCSRSRVCAMFKVPEPLLDTYTDVVANASASLQAIKIGIMPPEGPLPAATSISCRAGSWRHTEQLASVRHCPRDAQCQPNRILGVTMKVTAGLATWT